MSFLPPPQDARTVKVKVQVIDVEPFALDLVVPTYITAVDLTQRVARDAGLGAYWEDGTRRQYWIRCRGRVMTDKEKLDDWNVVDGELLHLLPQPPAGSGIIERPPEYPVSHGYPGAGWPQVVGTMFALSVWAAAWSAMLTLNPGGLWAVLYGLFPGIGLSIFCTSFARHVWGGDSTRIRIAMTGLVLYFSLLTFAQIPSIALQVNPQHILFAAGPAFLGGVLGVLQGWLAWFGPVEGLPDSSRVAAQAQAAAQTQLPICAICNQGIEPSVQADCMFRCGRVFHSGCYKARQSMVGDSMCAVCGFRPG